MARPRKPTKLRILEGKRGHSRPINENEPEPKLGAPSMPAGLSAWGKTLWRNVVEELDRLELLTVVDAGALHAAVIGADTGNAADRAIRRFVGRVNTGKATRDEVFRLSVMNNVSKKGWNQFKAFATEFGMTPASRSRLTVEQAPAKGSRQADSVERVLCG